MPTTVPSITHDDQSTLPYAVTNGDRITDLTGPLAYTFGNYKIAPTSQPDIIPGGLEITPHPALGEGQFSIMTWNVENLFDILDPHPASPPLPTVSEYRHPDRQGGPDHRGCRAADDHRDAGSGEYRRTGKDRRP